MRVYAATMRDVDAVLADLSDQHRAELDASGIALPAVRARYAEVLKGGTGRAASISGRPAAVFAAAIEQKRATTYFAATNAYFSAGISAVRHARRFLAGTRREFGPLSMATRSRFPGLERWLTIIGYALESERDGVRVFVYR